MMTGRINRQPLTMLAAVALLLPAIIALAVWFHSNQQQRREDAEREALSSAQHIVELADRELDANMRILALLADAPALANGPSEAWRELASSATRQTPGWRAVILRRAGSDTVLFQSAQSQDGRRIPRLPAKIGANGLIEGVVRDGRYCPCVILHRTAAYNPSLIVTLLVDPDRFQAIVRNQSLAAGVSAIFDSDGHIAARASGYEERVGTEAAMSAQKVIESGRNGLYNTVSIAGTPMFAAYAISKRTGWSAREAVDRPAVESARAGANAATATGILAALALAAGLALFAMYEARARRRRESDFLETQKSEAINRFAGTVVHDLRNVLSAINAGVATLSQTTDVDEATKLHGELRNTAERGERLTNQLLNLVGSSDDAIRTIDLRELFTGSEDLLRRALGDGIQFTWVVDDAARYVRANSRQLELALLNLAVNASEALEGDGRFAINTAKDGNRVVIAASDNGPGIPPNQRDTVFDPYYTTKAQGKGNSLGLPQVVSAMRQVGGDVSVIDSPNGGACFLLILDAGEPSAEETSGKRH